MGLLALLLGKPASKEKPKTKAELEKEKQEKERKLWELAEEYVHEK